MTRHRNRVLQPYQDVTLLLISMTLGLNDSRQEIIAEFIGEDEGRFFSLRESWRM